MQYHAVQSNTITLPEAKRTQGIESVTCMIFFRQNNFKLISVRNMIQVINSIPWVRCASGNVLYSCSLLWSKEHKSVAQVRPTYPHQQHHHCQSLEKAWMIFHGHAGEGKCANSKYFRIYMREYRIHAQIGGCPSEKSGT